MFTNDLIIVGTLPDDLIAILQQREVPYTLQELHITSETTNHYKDNNMIECSEQEKEKERETSTLSIQWVDEQSGNTWKATLILKNYDRETLEPKSPTSTILPTLSTPTKYVILQNSWEHTILHTLQKEEFVKERETAVVDAREKKSFSLLSQENEERERELGKEHNLPIVSEPTEVEQEASLEITQEEAKGNKVDLFSHHNEVTYSHVTGRHISEYDCFNNLYLKEDHRMIVDELLYFLAPVRRYLTEILHHVFMETKLRETFQEKYSIEDVEYILHFISEENTFQQYDLNETGFVKIDIERFDSTRVKQSVANRAFLRLCNKCRSSFAKVEEEKQNVYSKSSCNSVSNDSNNNNNDITHNMAETWEVERANVLRAMELYADRDVMISARTGGGGIIAGLASHKRYREDGVSSLEDEMRNNVSEHEQEEQLLEHDRNSKDSGVNCNKKAMDIEDVNYNNNNNNINHVYDDANETVERENDKTRYSSSNINNEQELQLQNKRRKRNNNTELDVNVGVTSSSNNNNINNSNLHEFAEYSLKSHHHDNAQRHIKFTSLSQCGFDLDEFDLSNEHSLEETQKVCDNVLAEYYAYLREQHSESTENQHNITNESCNDGRFAEERTYTNFTITSYEQFSSISIIYTSLLIRYNALHTLLTAHEMFTHNVGRWWAQTSLQDVTHELLLELRNWQDKQQEPRRLLVELYSHLHKAVYTIERGLEEYLALHALKIL